MKLAEYLACIAGLLILPTLVSAQPMGDKKKADGTPIILGESFTLHSNVLGEDRTVYVALPMSYKRGIRQYPVLYLTDAQYNFEHTCSTVDFLERNRIIPEMIVVGITDPDRVHDLYSTRADFKRGSQTIPFPTSGNGDQFLNFIEKELIPWIESNYRTSTYRVLAGHSAGGNFALHAARTKPGLFQAVIAVSPWLPWDNHKERDALLALVASGKIPLRTLFLSYADEFPDVKNDIEALSNALRSANIPTLRWSLSTYPAETHDSTGIKGYYDGLRMVFDGWDYPRDPETFLLKGSLKDMKLYYQRMSEKLGTAFLPPENVVNELGYQFLGTNTPDDAITTFRFNTQNYPRSANTWDSLAEGLEKTGKVSEAIEAYKKAVTVATETNDPALDSFKKHLDHLTKTAPNGGQSPAPSISPSLANADLTGKWTVVVDAPGQAVYVMMEVKQKGIEFTGTANTDFGPGTIDGGKVFGNKFTGVLHAEIAGQKSDFMIEGTINGDKITGTFTNQSFGSTPFSGVKSK